MNLKGWKAGEQAFGLGNSSAIILSNPVQLRGEAMRDVLAVVPGVEAGWYCAEPLLA